MASSKPASAPAASSEPSHAAAADRRDSARRTLLVFNAGGTSAKRLALAALLVVVPVAASFDAGISSSPDTRPSRFWRMNSASAQTANVSAKEAFDAARELGTTEAWDAFLASYPSGFYADLARAYLKKLADTAGPPPRDAAAASAVPAGEPPTIAPTAEPAATPSPGLPPTDPGRPAVARGGDYMGFPEKFNRYYTDPAWQPSRTVFVSPSGRGSGESRDTPASVQAGVAAATPGTRIHFLPGKYQGCFEFTQENSGTYDEPIVLYGERNDDKSLGVTMTCCRTGRQTCFNFEAADYVAVDGFELVGGRYGVRAVGADYEASKHGRGIAVLDCNGHDQQMDPFFSGQVDWAVWERNVAYAAKEGDGHGIYLSNGGDWNILRYNETYGNASTALQINADPQSTCKETGIEFDDARCDAYAGEGEGGRGASDYFLIDANYFHNSAVGPNFTGVRRSVIRNNIFGPQTRHNVSFWQQTDNPKLGSSDNKILHNLFITTDRHGVQFKNHSTRNQFVNNVIVGVRIAGGKAGANRSATLMEVDESVSDNVYRGNLYIAGKIEGRSPSEEEKALAEFSPTWFAKFPTSSSHDPNDLKPSAEAPFLNAGTLSDAAPSDRNGAPRSGQVDLGPIEVE